MMSGLLWPLLCFLEDSKKLVPSGHMTINKALPNNYDVFFISAFKIKHLRMDTYDIEGDPCWFIHINIF